MPFKHADNPLKIGKAAFSAVAGSRLEMVCRITGGRMNDCSYVNLARVFRRAVFTYMTCFQNMKKIECCSGDDQSVKRIRTSYNTLKSFYDVFAGG